jgi:hypothetical protein
MALHWDFAWSETTPEMATWNAITGDTHPYGDDVWITEAALHINFDVPGLPISYREDQQDGRVIYVSGLPFGATTEAVMDLFSRVADVTKCPCLVSLQSGHTFRWVVFGDPAGAELMLTLTRREMIMDDVLRVTPAMPPGRMIMLVARNWENEDDKGGDDQLTPTQKTIHAHPNRRPTTTQSGVTCIKIPSANTEPLTQSGSPQARASDVALSAYRASTNSISSAPRSPEVPSLFASDPVADPFVTQAASWAAIASRMKTDTKIIDVQPTKRVRLQPVSRDSSITSVRRIEVNGEPLEEQKRVVLLLNLPHNIHLRDVSDAVREGPLVKIVFGQNDDDKTRYAGVIFQHATDATNFYEALQRENRLSRPDRFRFVVDAFIGDPFPLNDDIKAMGYPINATRRLTIVKARFFFMFKEEHLKRLCQKLIGPENIQLIWLYNGGNATIVFADVASSIRVKKELDRRASMAGKEGGESEIWSGLQTTYSKDPCVIPLDDLKTTLHD